MDQITVSHVEGVTCSDEPTENYNPTLQSILASFILLFGFYRKFTVWFSLSYQPSFHQQETAVFSKKNTGEPNVLAQYRRCN